MKIMEIISGATTNGAIIHCLLLTRELLRRGNQVTLVCRPGAWIGQQLASDGVEVITSNLNRWPLNELRRIAEVCRSREIDVIHTHMSRAHFFGVLLRWFSGVPCVATAHNRLIQPHWMFNDRVIANSDATRRFHRRFNLVGSRRIETVHCFVDFERFAAVPDSVRHEIRAEFGMNENHLLIGQIGQVCPRKGLLYMVRAMPQVAARFPHAKLFVVGAFDHPKYRKYVAKVRRESEQLDAADRIVWTGPRNDVPEFLTALDLFVQPSLEEAQGIAALEAMVRHVPVIATPVGGVQEMVRHGETGWLVPPADPDALASAIVRLANDPVLRGRLVKCGHELVKNRFSAASQVPHVEAVFAAASDRAKAA